MARNDTRTTAMLLDPRNTLPVGSAGVRTTGWLGCLMLIATEASLFGYLIFAYLYLAVQNTQHWPGLRRRTAPQAGHGQTCTQAFSGISSVAWCSQTGQVTVAV